MECRACGQKLSGRFLLQYTNMPKSAQVFPDGKNASWEKGVDLTLLQCRFCGMIQLAGEAVPYYRDVIRAAGVSEEMRVFREKQFREWVERYNLSGKRVLEIGCGCGEYLAFMKKTFVDVRGLEHRRESVEKGRRAGYKIVEGFVESASTFIAGAPFDGFYTMNFLEHIPNPGEFLRGIIFNLSDNAVGLIEVPNVNMILKERLYSEFIQDHLLYFTQDSLRRLLEWNGFEVISCNVVWYDYILSAEVRRRKPIEIEGFIQQQKKIKRDVKMFLDRMEQRGLNTAVWGAGHQALANLSLLEMRNRICCVIDSADFKQNKVTPATHIPVLSPQILSEGTIGAVLIMAGGYSDEIRQSMRQNYPQIVCAILRQDGIEEI